MSKLGYHSTVIDSESGIGKQAIVAIYEIGTQTLATIRV